MDLSQYIKTIFNAQNIPVVITDIGIRSGKYISLIITDNKKDRMDHLRKALGQGPFGDKYITNVQGRGYCFAAPVTRHAAEQGTDNSFSKSSNLPPALGRMIGRDDVVLEIRDRFRTERLITVLGAGGIGKTTVALAAAHTLLADFSGAVFFVDLSAVRDREQVAGAIASAIKSALTKFLQPA